MQLQRCCVASGYAWSGTNVELAVAVIEKVFQYHIVAVTMRKLNSTVAENRVYVNI